MASHGLPYTTTRMRPPDTTPVNRVKMWGELNYRSAMFMVHRHFIMVLKLLFAHRQLTSERHQSRNTALSGARTCSPHLSLKVCDRVLPKTHAAPVSAARPEPDAPSPPAARAAIPSRGPSAAEPRIRGRTSGAARATGSANRDHNDAVETFAFRGKHTLTCASDGRSLGMSNGPCNSRRRFTVLLRAVCRAP